MKKNIYRLRRTHIYVRTNDQKSRERLIEFIEKEGFSISEEFADTKQGILQSPYPIKVDFRQKTYGVIHNTTCAAAAVAGGAVVGVEEFYERYGCRRCCLI